MTYRPSPLATPGIGLAAYRSAAPADDDRRKLRFVTQSHALGTPIASPHAMLIAAAVAVAVFVIGLRLSGD